MGLPVVYAAWHGRNIWRAALGKAALTVEPLHLIVIGLLVSFAGVVWQWQRTEAGGRGLIQSTTTSVPNQWDLPPGPKSGPIGPIAGAELLELFRTLRKPCTIKITAPPENNNLKDTLRWIAEYGGCKLDSNTNRRNVDDLEEPKPTKVRGIVVHWANENDEIGEKVYRFFEALSFVVALSNRISPKYAVWIDIGPGSPWK